MAMANGTSITRRGFLKGLVAAGAAPAVISASAVGLAGRFAAAEEHKAGGAPLRPNIVFILADDLGYADLGCYGQQKIKTPQADRLAAEGTRFTQAYCGTSVCAPSRCALMTGQHIGHAPIRANRAVQPEGQMPMPEGTFTVARLLKDAGYATACIGKWGLGFWGTSGDPLKNGFDYFFGYNCQSKAHEYYPEYLWRNGQKVELGGKQYSHDLIAADALEWVRKNKDRPFFLYLAFTIPHAKYQAPDVEPYAKENWPAEMKTYAAMVTRMDRDVGRLMALLKELGLDEKTIVFFASDNGAAGGKIAPFFQSGGPLRDIKRSMYEGGIRAPMIARWPGRVPAGKTSDEPWAFWDFLPTCGELTGTKAPAGVRVDGLSVAGLLMGGPAPKREYLYWELHEPTFRQAVRFGDWKAVVPAVGKPVELYNLKTDPSERNDLAAKEPETLKKAKDLFAQAHEDSPEWPIKQPAAGGGRAGRAKKGPPPEVNP